MGIESTVIRAGTTAEWADTDGTDGEAAPVLAAGELGIDVTTGQIKVGDGATAFASLKALRPFKITTVTLVAGTKATSDTTITANTVIVPVLKALGTVTAAKPIAVTRSAGASFTLTSSDNTDTSTFQVLIFEP
jgi:hypothetical protein